MPYGKYASMWSTDCQAAPRVSGADGWSTRDEAPPGQRYGSLGSTGEIWKPVLQHDLHNPACQHTQI